MVTNTCTYIEIYKLIHTRDVHGNIGNAGFPSLPWDSHPSHKIPIPPMEFPWKWEPNCLN